MPTKTELSIKNRLVVLVQLPLKINTVFLNDNFNFSNSNTTAKLANLNATDVQKSGSKIILKTAVETYKLPRNSALVLSNSIYSYIYPLLFIKMPKNEISTVEISVRESIPIGTALLTQIEGDFTSNFYNSSSNSPNVRTNNPFMTSRNTIYLNETLDYEKIQKYLIVTIDPQERILKNLVKINVLDEDEFKPQFVDRKIFSTYF